jgi:DNA polymerase-3 subunit epsilon
LFAGAAPPRLVDLDADVLRSGEAFGTYRSARDARKALESLARENRWCLKVLGFESGPGSCFGLQVGRCTGACTGKESAAMHLTRVKMRWMSQRLEPWPHEGPMMVREGRGERAQVHIIDGWQHLATIGSDSDVDGVDEMRRLAARRGAFDIDGYRILTRMLREPRYRPTPLPGS